MISNFNLIAFQIFQKLLFEREFFSFYTKVINITK